jgi:hypothetical protein
LPLPKKQILIYDTFWDFSPNFEKNDQNWGGTLEAEISADRPKLFFPEKLQELSSRPPKLRGFKKK